MATRIMHRIATLARIVEPNHDALWEWMAHTPVDELRGRTPVEAAMDGDGERVVELLEAIVAGRRD